MQCNLYVSAYRTSYRCLPALHSREHLLKSKSNSILPSNVHMVGNFKGMRLCVSTTLTLKQRTRTMKATIYT